MQIACVNGFRAAVLLVALALPALPQHKVTDEEVARVHWSAGLIDTHNDVTSRTVEGFDIGKRSKDSQTDLPKLKEGGVGAVFFAAYVGAEYVKKGQSAHRVLEMTDTIRHDIAARYPNDFELATSASEIEAARKRNRVAALIGVEGGHAIEGSLRTLRDLYALGARYMTLTHANTNTWADSSGDMDKKVPHHNGLTPFGKEVIREMNRLGMIVDVSHVADKTFWDVMETSTAPVFASHSSCRALSNIPRNMTDDMIRAMAKKGGVIQINFGCEFLSQKSADASPWTGPAASKRVQAAPEKDRRKISREIQAKMPRATVADVVAHIDHVVKIAGIDAVGIGTDYSGVECVPVGLEDVSKFPVLTRALLEKGYTAEQIRKIYSGNTLRLMRTVERAARR